MSETKESKGFWGSLKGLVVEETPDASKATPAVAGATVVYKQDPSTVAFSPSPVAQVVTSDPTVRKKLEALLEKAAPPGYQEVMATIATLVDIVPTEEGRYKAAVRLALKKGHTLDQLLGDVDERLRVLETAKQNFAASSEKNSATLVSSKEESARSATALAQEKQNQAMQLQKEAEELRLQAANLFHEAQDEKNRVALVVSQFLATYEEMKKEFQAERSKIEACGKEA